ncbi:MAG: hypothetical protein EXR72_03445 [Myxococcales bacterium]|nr:hypothetical protein [Myxococcales bacterium]
MRSLQLPIVILLAVGCGSGPKYKVDDVSLAPIPIAEKQAIFAAQNEISVARSERQKADADVAATEKEIISAESEHEQAKLETKKAQLGADEQKKLGDATKLTQAARELEVAEAGQHAASVKIDWLSKRKKWQREQGEAADAHATLAESKVELEKARLASSKGIKPNPDFKLENFADDFASKAKAWSAAKRQVEDRQTEVDRLGDSWRQLVAQHTQMRAPAPAATPAATK